MPRLLAVNVGLPQNIQWRGETVHTGIWKHPVQGRCAARRLNLEGDGQGDLAGHGGEQRAVMAYQIDSYRYWERTLGRSDFTFGQFSENLTLGGSSMVTWDHMTLSKFGLRLRIRSFSWTSHSSDVLGEQSDDPASEPISGSGCCGTAANAVRFSWKRSLSTQGTRPST